MKDTDLRAIVLQKYYQKRREGHSQWKESDFTDVEENLDGSDIFRICDQLAEHGLIDWKPVRSRGGTIGGIGKITANGIDVIEGTSRSPISMTFDHSITVQDSTHVQVGNNNIQDISLQLQRLVDVIEQSSASGTEKEEAKTLLKRLIEHPLFTSIAGGLASTIKF
jgi:hypothetical protein